MPVIPDFLAVIRCSWGKPYLSRFPVQGFGRFTALHKAEEHRLVRMTEVEKALAAYLALHNISARGPLKLTV